MSVTLNENDVRELQWVADVLVAAANGEPTTQGPQQAARDLAKVIESKLPEPVEQFQPGDVVRYRRSGTTYALGLDSFTRLVAGSGNGPVGEVLPYGGHRRTLEQFTSEDFERVSL
jgi:hypothetical protein